MLLIPSFFPGCDWKLIHLNYLIFRCVFLSQCSTSAIEERHHSLFAVVHYETRMHSSRMRTVRSARRGGGVSAEEGMPAQGGVCLGGVCPGGGGVCPGGSGGVCLGGGGMSAQGEGGCLPGGCLSRGCLPRCMLGYTPP